MAGVAAPVRSNTPARARPARVLVVAHGHPSLSAGGGEIAAYNLFLGLGRRTEFEAHFLARVATSPFTDRTRPLLAADGEREMLLQVADYDPFRLSNRKDEAALTAFARLLGDLQPEVVHFHHFFGLGIELLWLARQILPNAVLAVTFHEYLSICHNHGQMLKTVDRRLCQAASPLACGQCFPEIAPGRFARRASFLKTLLSLADLYLSPSQFLIDRYLAWGLPAAKFQLIENGIVPPTSIAPPRPVANVTIPGIRNRFGFFGQVTPYKGLDVLIDAVSQVPDQEWGDDARLLVYGGALERQSPAFQAEMRRLIANAGARVRFMGGYRNEDLPELMAGIDWVVVPSIWWENAPVVIQEAFLHGRPVICSGIGGMAEKVRNRIDGLHARPGNATDLADRLGEALRRPELWQDLRANLRPPPDLDEIAGRHAQAYRGCRAGVPASGAAAAVAGRQRRKKTSRPQMDNPALAKGQDSLDRSTTHTVNR